MAQTAHDTKRASDYETVFILRPDIDAETSEKVIARAVSALESTSGKLTKVESWGRRRLAYPIARQRKGFYVYLRYLGFKGTVAEVERNLRMLDPVIRYMTVLNAKDIDLAGVSVDPEEIKVRRIEVSAEDDDREESFAESLGLSDEQRPAPPPPPPAPEPAAEETPAAPAGDA